MFDSSLATRGQTIASNDWTIVNNELVTIWKEAGVTWFKALHPEFGWRD